MRPLPVVCVAVSVAVLLPALARADDAHYQNFLVGERAAGMGGAFTAIANDPSGTYYNPAGLVDLKSGLLSANLNFYSFQQQSLANALHVAGRKHRRSVQGLGERGRRSAQRRSRERR